MSEIDRYREEINNLKIEVDRFKIQNQSLRNENTEIQNRYKIDQKKILEIVKEREHLSDEIIDKDREIESIKRELLSTEEKWLNDQAQHKIQIKQETDQVKNHYEGELELFKRNLDKFSREKENILEKVQNYQERDKTRSKITYEAEELATKHRISAEGLKLELEKEKAENDRLCIKNEELARKASILDARVKSLEQENLDLESFLQKKKKREKTNREEEEKENSTEKKNKRKKQKKIEERSQKLEEENAVLRNKLKRANKKLVQLVSEKVLNAQQSNNFNTLNYSITENQKNNSKNSDIRRIQVSTQGANINPEKNIPQNYVRRDVERPNQVERTRIAQKSPGPKTIRKIERNRLGPRERAENAGYAGTHTFKTSHKQIPYGNLDPGPSAKLILYDDQPQSRNLNFGPVPDQEPSTALDNYPLKPRELSILRDPLHDVNSQGNFILN